MQLRPPYILILGGKLLANIVSCLTYPKLHLQPHLKDYNFSFLYTAATSELLQFTTAIYCTKYCALSGLNSFFVLCVTRNKYSNTVNWSTLFKTYIRTGHPLLVASLVVFSHFLQLSSLYMYVTDTSLQVPLAGPDSHYVYFRES